MRDKIMPIILLIVTVTLQIGCNKDNENQSGEDCINSDFFSEYSSRNFNMGFSTWAYAKTIESVDNTYLFISNQTDIYSEHIDYKIPWNAWVNSLPLPTEFTDEITARVSRKLTDKKLTLSVSLLNNERTDLSSDFDGTIPNYTNLNDIEIEDAYFKHVQYITSQLNPDYLIIAIEVNELLKNAPEKWNAYKLLMGNVKTRIQQVFPSLRISESITLHNFYEPDVSNPEVYLNELVNYANTMDFVAISFYPYFKGLKTKEDFQEAFDFLHEKINKPIAFSETGHLSEDLTVDSYNLFIAGNQCEQNEYLEVLLTNAQEQSYEYIIWWAYRDYNELWETFPEEIQDLGKLWLSTGIINEDGAKKKAYSTWEMVLNK
jgi:hypothetical protein